MRKFTIILSIFTLVLACSEIVSAQRITITIAGNGIAGNSGDGGPGRQAEVNSSQYIASDLAGNVYFVDGNTIREVFVKNGTIATIAGGGTSTADGIPATSASITPGSICANAIGDIFVVTGDKIKKIDAITNIITTYAGSGTSGYLGDGGPATAALFHGIAGICTDAVGNIYVADRSNNRIRKIAAGTTTVTTFAGTGITGYTGDGGPAISASLSGPNFICSNPIGDIYFSDQANVYIRRINAITGVISTYAGGGGYVMGNLRLNTLLGPLSGICFDGSYNFVFNELSCSCRKVDHFTDSVSYIGGDYGTESYKDDTNSLYAWMDHQSGLTTDAKGSIFIVDYGNKRIRKMIKLTSAPVFAFGEGQSINPCPGYPFILNSQMAVADLDLGQTETWTVIVPPINGVLAGFPATVMSNGVNKLATPSGLSYSAYSTFTGADSFRVRVTDGTQSDTVTIYVSVQPSSPAVLSGTTNVCAGLTTLLATSVPGGTWSSSNANASVDPSTGRVSGITAGVDTIIYNMVTPCALISTVPVTVNPTPAAGIISGSDTVCKGATVSLSETVPGGTWSSLSTYYATVGSTSGIVSGLAYSDFSSTIQYTVKNAWCSATATKLVFVNAPVSPISGINTLCVGTAVTYYNEVLGGTWSATNGNVLLTFPTYYPTGTGATAGGDTIIYTNTNSCGTATATLTVMVSAPPTAGMISGPSDVCVGSTVTLSSTVAGGTWSTKYYYAFAGYSSGVITGSMAGKDSVIYTVGTYGCNATAGFPINVDAAPLAGTITGATNVCMGATIALTDGATSGVWSVTNANATVSGSGIVSGIAAGSDSVIYAVANACGVAQAVKKITVNPLPVVSLISGPSSVCTGSTISMTDATPGGVWSVANFNATISGSGIVSGATAGSDSVIYSLSNACGSAAALKVIAINVVPVAGTIAGPSSVCAGAMISVSDATPGGVWSVTNPHATVSGSGFVSGITAGSDSVVYAVSNSCGSASAAMVITINPLPAAGTITGAASVCVGASVSLTDAVTGGLWSASNPNATVSGAGTVSGVTAGSDSVIYAVSNVCGTANAIRVIAVNPLPVVPGTIWGAASVCAGSIISLTDATPGGSWTVTNPNAIVAGSGVVTGVVAGSDSVVYAITNLCGTAAAAKVITIDPLPDPGTITGATDVCAGSTVSLANTTSGGMWSVTNTNAAISVSGTVLGTTAGSDSVLYSVSNGCGSATAIAVINVVPMPEAGTITGKNSVCIGALVSLADGMSGGAWSTSNSTANISATGVVSGASIGKDTIIYTVHNICGTATTLHLVQVEDCGATGTQMPSMTASINIYPNPASSVLNIKWTELQSGKAEVEIADCVGRIVLRDELVNNATNFREFDISGFKDGVYVLRIGSGTLNATFKVIVNR